MHRHRFERGADFNAPPVASALVSQNGARGGGGYLVGDLVDVVVPTAAERTAHRAPVRLELSEVRRILGTTIDGSASQHPRLRDCTDRAGLLAGAAFRWHYDVTLPSWRLDLEREIDLIEEVARVYGYNRFANTLPAFEGSVK